MGTLFQRMSQRQSGNEHGVTVAEKSKLFSDGGSVGGEDEAASAGSAGGGEGAYEHEQRGAGEVEIGEESVDEPKIVRRVDENARATASRNELPFMLTSDAFQHAGRGGADRDHAAAFSFGLIDCARSFLGNAKALLVHDMSGEVLSFDRGEGAQAHMQRHIEDANAVCFQILEQFFSKMEPSSGGCHRTFLHSENGLITLHIILESGGGLPLNVGRERDFTNDIKRIEDI